MPPVDKPGAERSLNWRAPILALGLLMALACPADLRALPELTAVFSAGTEGYHTYRIPALVVTTQHTVLAFCEGRRNDRGDSGRIDLLMKRSTDGGRTWSAQQVIWSDGSNTCGNPAPVVDTTTGTIWLLMTWNRGTDQERKIIDRVSQDTRRAFVTHSEDDGCHWALPQEITATVKQSEWGWYATGPVNGIQLTRGPHRGRLVIPANHTEPAAAGSNQTAMRSHVIYSDDHGQTWKLGGSEAEKTDESTLVERPDGSLLHNMRSYHGQHRRAIATSADGGATWTPVHLGDALIEPICQACLLRVSWPEAGRKSRVLFANPASIKRERMTVRLSYDEGATWPVARVLHEGPAAYSGLACLPDQTVLCLFERGEKNPYETISLARFPLAWLEQDQPGH